jgi:hypothetical protein
MRTLSLIVLLSFAVGCDSGEDSDPFVTAEGAYCFEELIAPTTTGGVFYRVSFAVDAQQREEREATLTGTCTASVVVSQDFATVALEDIVGSASLEGSQVGDDVSFTCSFAGIRDAEFEGSLRASSEGGAQALSGRISGGLPAPDGSPGYAPSFLGSGDPIDMGRNTCIAFVP